MTKPVDNLHIRVLVICVFRDGRRILVARGLDESKSRMQLSMRNQSYL